MASYRITIVEIKPNVAASENQSGYTPAETEIFRQVVEDVNVKAIIRQLNATPRVRRKTAKTANA